MTNRRFFSIITISGCFVPRKKKGVKKDDSKVNEIYRHFKGNLYRIVTLAEHSETGEAMVVYQALYGDCKVYVRPLAMFTEKVDKVKYPEVTQEYRFELLPPVGMSGTEAFQEPAVKSIPEAPISQTEEAAPALDPLLEEFLDADSYNERLNILHGLHHRITDDMINTMAVVLDVEIQEGPLEERYGALVNCLNTLEKYECNRLR